MTMEFSQLSNNSFQIGNQSDGEFDGEILDQDDVAWILANAFLILTMQTGFGMLEVGYVSGKNVANIMVKNVVDVTIGGFTYWAVGYGLSFGPKGNAFMGWGRFFVSHPDDKPGMGSFYAHYTFHFSFATAATTIVSGGVAERMKLSAYTIFSFFNTFVYALPASWVWHEGIGFLNTLGFYDFAGGSAVHVVGGAGSLAAVIALGEREGRFGYKKDHYDMSSPVTALTGMFTLWWSWLSFNCGSTFGMSHGKWKIAAKVGVNTLNGSIGGSIGSMIFMAGVGLRNRKQPFLDIDKCILGILGGLLGVTSSASLISPAEAIICGMIGAFVAISLCDFIKFLKLDDPVGSVAVHLGGGFWTVISVALFGRDSSDRNHPRNGLFHGGGFRWLGIQCFGGLVIGLWAFIMTLLLFIILRFTIGIRMSYDDELLGADIAEHQLRAMEDGYAQKLEKAVDKILVGDSDEFEVIKKIFVETLKQTVLPPAQSSAAIRTFGGGGGGGGRQTFSLHQESLLNKNHQHLFAPRLTSSSLTVSRGKKNKIASSSNGLRMENLEEEKEEEVDQNDVVNNSTSQKIISKTKNIPGGYRHKSSKTGQQQHGSFKMDSNDDKLKEEHSDENGSFSRSTVTSTPLMAIEDDYRRESSGSRASSSFPAHDDDNSKNELILAPHVLVPTREKTSAKYRFPTSNSTNNTMAGTSRTKRTDAVQTFKSAWMKQTDK